MCVRVRVACGTNSRLIINSAPNNTHIAMQVARHTQPRADIFCDSACHGTRRLRMQGPSRLRRRASAAAVTSTRRLGCAQPVHRQTEHCHAPQSANDEEGGRRATKCAECSGVLASCYEMSAVGSPLGSGLFMCGLSSFAEQWAECARGAGAGAGGPPCARPGRRER